MDAYRGLAAECSPSVDAFRGPEWLLQPGGALTPRLENIRVKASAPLTPHESPKTTTSAQRQTSVEKGSNTHNGSDGRGARIVSNKATTDPFVHFGFVRVCVLCY